MSPANPPGSCAQADSTGNSDKFHERDGLKDDCYPTSEEVRNKDSLESGESIISSSIENLEVLKNVNNCKASNPRDLLIGKERTSKRSHFKYKQTGKQTSVEALPPFGKLLSSAFKDDEKGSVETEEMTVVVDAVCAPTFRDDIRCILNPFGSAPPLERTVLRTSGSMSVTLLARYIHSALGFWESQTIGLRCCGEDLKDLSNLITLQQLAEQIRKEPRTPIDLEYSLL